jgi:hypothetical protein
MQQKRLQQHQANLQAKMERESKDRREKEKIAAFGGGVWMDRMAVVLYPCHCQVMWCLPRLAAEYGCIVLLLSCIMIS